MPKSYLTTSIAYPNANPHIGYALELVQADCLARFRHLWGDEVRLVTGVDEHGLKIQRVAATAGQEPAVFVAVQSARFRELADRLQVRYDRFIRTTDPDHIAVAQALWRRCAAAGDIRKERYQAWYNVKEEEFLGRVADVPDPSVFGVDPQYLEQIDEENYFFSLSRYAEPIAAALREDHYRVVPANRKQELLNFLEGGLQDISISREASKLTWGIPVPGDQSQVMYVWFDALTNYLTASGSTVAADGTLTLGEWWPAQVHCIGKDISRFHGLIWPGMLLSAGLPLPEELLVHGFITSGGQKMSKSIGNVIDPIPLLDRYGPDPIRWFLLKEIPATDDGDCTPERIAEVYTADLANDYGNLVSRVWTLAQKFAGGVVPTTTTVEGNAYAALLSTVVAKYTTALGQERRFDLAFAAVREAVVFCNQQVDTEKPWLLAKDPAAGEHLAYLLYNLLETIRQVTFLLQPALVVSTAMVATQVFPGLPETLWTSAEAALRWGALPAGLTLGSAPTILFPKPERRLTP